MSEELKQTNDMVENYENVLSRIKIKCMLGIVGGILLSVISVVLFFTMPDWTIGVCVLFMGIAVVLYSLYRFGGKTTDNIVVVKAKCVERHRTGYRKQYLEYMFEDEEQNTFIIKTSQKEKFRKGMRYELCFAKNKYQEQKEIIGNNLLDYILL